LDATACCRAWPRRFGHGALAGLLVVAIAWGTWQVLRARGTPSAPPSPASQFASALAALERGDAARLTETLQALKPHPEFAPHVRLLNAVWLLKTGRVQDALPRFATLPATGELREPVLLYSAQALHAVNRLAEAEMRLRVLVQEQPANSEARRWLGIIYYDLGAYDAALIELRELARLAPEDYRPHRLSGLMYRDFEQNQEAIDSYLAALERSPPAEVQQEIREELAATLVSERRYDRALATIAEARPTAVLLALAAQCDWSAGRRESALDQLAAARRLDSGDRTALLLEAEIRTAAGDRAAALALLREAVRWHPYDAESHYRLGLALRDAGLTDEAEQELAAWTRLKELATRLSELNFKALGDPHDIAVREQLAEVCDELGKPELAAMWRQTVAALRNDKRPRGP
jgi:tetratricopeptide (TPR) repeat protein